MRLSRDALVDSSCRGNGSPFPAHLALLSCYKGTRPLRDALVDSSCQVERTSLPVSPCSSQLLQRDAALAGHGTRLGMCPGEDRAKTGPSSPVIARSRPSLISLQKTQPTSKSCILLYTGLLSIITESMGKRKAVDLLMPLNDTKKQKKHPRKLANKAIGCGPKSLDEMDLLFEEVEAILNSEMDINGALPPKKALP
ncbi:hypothetical protein NDU88_006455 [Pleurodeles waltl]|uniref:Uncharacterized protein n=1 Tax=Pleurodeles waltl TaxID=8319 RepID=A0AAV7VQS2_PLEWA|nr:hypothetical protein NDU88_006455 [Pleurodeles waltl]